MQQTTQETRRVIDITGPENSLILLAAPGDEVTECGGLIAQACARGRPPFIVILGDGAADGSARLARDRERASRVACRNLGLSEDRLLFVGLRQSAFPAIGTIFFKALQAAMAELSWRRDCNVILAPFTALDLSEAGDAVTTWQLANALAAEIERPLLACCRIGALPWLPARQIWRLDTRHGNTSHAKTGLLHAHDITNAGYEHYGLVA